MNSTGSNDSEEPHNGGSPADGQRYVLRLYIAGNTPRSARAIASIRGICDNELAGQVDLEVIDIYQHPESLEQDQIVATPTLVKELPNPLRRFIGDMSDVDRIIVGLNLKPRS